MKNIKRILASIVAIALIIGFVPISLAASKNITTDKSEYLVADTIKVTVEGLTDEQNQNAYVGIYVKGYLTNKGSYDGKYSYIRDLNDGKTWEVEAPKELGTYELRLVTEDGDKYTDIQKLEFKVVSLKAKAEDVKINKISYLPNDSVTVTIKGLSKGQIDNRAWVGLFKKDDKIDASSYDSTYSYVSDFSDRNIWSFKAPKDFGGYELRVFTADPANDNRESVLFATIPFTIKGNIAKPGDLKINKTEFKKGEPIKITITGLTQGQIEDHAWAGVFLPKDDMKASSFNGLYTFVSDLRDGKTWEINAPNEPGFYEIRVFSKDLAADKREPAFFGKLSFNVVKAEQKAGYSFKISPAVVTLAKGSTKKLDVRATPLTGGREIPANNMITYTSRNVKIATVTNLGVIKGVGLDKGKSTGTTFIDLKYNKTVIKTIKVTVTKGK